MCAPLNHEVNDNGILLLNPWVDVMHISLQKRTQKEAKELGYLEKAGAKVCLSLLECVETTLSWTNRVLTPLEDWMHLTEHSREGESGRKKAWSQTWASSEGVLQSNCKGTVIMLHFFLGNADVCIVLPVGTPTILANVLQSMLKNTVNTQQDNGVGMQHSQIPDMLGRVLSGTKYGVAQTRGKFGLGAKMALIWSKMSTGLPITIRSAQRGSSTLSFYRLDIDIQRNEPNIHEEKLLENPERWHGAELSVIIEGNWSYYRAKILKYLQLIAVITPYTQVGCV